MKYLWRFMFVTVLLGCSEIVPGTCYENPAGGAGGADSLAVGAGVGATTSGDYAEPPKGPLDHGDGVGGFGDVPPRQPQEATDPPPGCNGGEDPAFGKPATAYIDCRKRGLVAAACSEVCTAAGAVCGAIAGHPYKSGAGTGQLTWCKNGEPTYTCTYTFPNGDGCAITYNPIKPYWICMYAGGG
jgi:hypothetical protein